MCNLLWKIAMKIYFLFAFASLFNNFLVCCLFIFIFYFIGTYNWCQIHLFHAFHELKLNTRVFSVFVLRFMRCPYFSLHKFIFNFSQRFSICCCVQFLPTYLRLRRFYGNSSQFVFVCNFDLVVKLNWKVLSNKRNSEKSK